MKRRALLLLTLIVLGSILACSSKSLDGGSNTTRADGGSDGDAETEAAASAGTRAAGQECDSENTCAAGLSCLEFAVHPPGAACRVVGTQCTKPCAAGDNPGDNCASLGPKYRCFKGCGETFACGPTG